MSRRELVTQLRDARGAFGGMGTKTVKLKLNSLVKTCHIAKALRLALETEDCSTLGKKYHGAWSDHYYNKKGQLIVELIELFNITGWLYGKHIVEGFPKYVIYFEIPGCEQISFHCRSLPDDIPDYPKAWDEKRNSTFGKLEAAINQYFAKENKDENQFLFSSKQ